MGMGSGKGTAGVVGGVAKAAPPPGAAVEAAGIGGRAAEAARGLGGIGNVPLGRAAAFTGGAAVAGGIGVGAAYALGDVARGLVTNREREFAERVSKLGDKTDASVRAALEQEAAAGGAWQDPTWPYRLRGHLLRSDSERAKAGSPEFTGNANNDIAGWDQAFLRREWIRFFYGDAAARTLFP